MDTGKYYSMIVDPVMKPVRELVANEVYAGEKVIDIACGTGAQIFELSPKISSGYGIDISGPMINHAQNTAGQLGISNVNFLICNAADLSIFKPGRFDVAIMSMALHQFEPVLIPSILDEMKLVSRKMIFVDYSVPLPMNFAGIGSRITEYFAGKEHSRNFRQYYKNGGLRNILPGNNLKIAKTVYTAKGALQMVVCTVE